MPGSLKLLFVCLRRELERFRSFVRGPEVFDIPPRKGAWKSHAVTEVGKTGLQVAAVGCECMSGESLGVLFGRRLKASVNSPSRWKKWAGPPHSFYSSKKEVTDCPVR